LKFGSDQFGANAESAGSGTLAKVGSTFGVLTAAHVIEALPRKGEVGVVVFEHETKLQKQTIEMSSTGFALFHSPPLAFEEWEKESIPRMEANALDQLVATGKIRVIDRERVTFIVLTIVLPPKYPDDPRRNNAA
jgi:hypothetical protein